MNTRYRTTLQLRTGGSEWALLSNGTRHEPRIVRSLEATVLASKPLWDSADLNTEFCQATGLTIDDLLASGLIEAFQVSADDPLPVCPAIVTADRPASCLQASAFMVNELSQVSSPGGRRPLIIVDNSPGETDRQMLADLEELATSSNTAILVVQQQAAQRLVADIRRVDPAAAEVADFALCTSRPGTTSVGASRNLLTLLTRGNRLLSIDDDIRGPALSPAEGPLALSDVATCESIVPMSQCDLSGWTAANLIATHAGRLGARIGSGPDRIVLTTSGMRGDCGSEHPWHEIYSATGSQGRSPLTRKVVRGVSTPTVTRVGSLMAYAYGFVNDAQVPPFMPIGRNQDGAFASLLASMDPHSYTCHLPVYVVHSPVDRRNEGAYRDVATAIADPWRTNDVISTIVASVGARNMTRCTFISDVAAFLTHLAERVGAGDLSVLRDLKVRFDAGRAEAIDRWASFQGVVTRMRVLRRLHYNRQRSMESDRHLIPIEWGELGNFGHYLRSCARLIQHWCHVVAVVESLPTWTSPWLALEAAGGVIRLDSH